MEKYFHFDKQKSLEELENDYWGEPALDTHLVVTCHKLRKLSVGSFEIEDMRIMIGQKIGLDFLVPLALERLEDDILAQGHFYPGDLLETVLRIDKEFWDINREYKAELERILNEAIIDLKDKLEKFHIATDDK